MDYEFSSKEELYQRVRPALRAKKSELNRLGMGYIQEVDIWNFLIESKWSRSSDLMLYDIVDDILNIENEKIDNYIKMKISKLKRTQHFDSSIEIL